MSQLDKLEPSGRTTQEILEGIDEILEAGPEFALGRLDRSTNSPDLKAAITAYRLAMRTLVSSIVRTAIRDVGGIDRSVQNVPDAKKMELWEIFGNAARREYSLTLGKFPLPPSVCSEVNTMFFEIAALFRPPLITSWRPHVPDA